MVSTAAAASPLERFVDRSRVLVVSAPRSDDANLRQQDAAIAAAGKGMRERDLVVIRIIGDAARDNAGSSLNAAQVRNAIGLPANAFGAVLVGKDGGVKLRSARAIPAASLFETIDAMPMRRQEKRARH